MIADIRPGAPGGQLCWSEAWRVLGTHAQSADLGWVVYVYALTFGLALVPGAHCPAISATFQRLFGGRECSRALGYLGGVVGLSTAIGPLIGGCSSRPPG
jgi:hypothetical protein